MSKWTSQDDNRLRLLYEAWDGDVIPIEPISQALGRSPGAVRLRAHKLGLTEPNRPRAARGRPAPIPVERICKQCNRPFLLRRPSDKQQSCSRSCAAQSRSSRPGGRFNSRGSKTGRRADLGGIFLRSSWEGNYARILNHWIKAGLIVSWDYEPLIFRFPVKRGNRAYTPDFRVWLPDGSYEWHEVKGYMDSASRIKLKRFALHFPEESIRLKLIDRAVYRQLTERFSSLPGWE